MSAITGPRYVLPPLEPPEDWTLWAACAEADPDAFFPDAGNSSAAAKKVCSSCEVREQCFDYAVARDERYGIWGGMGERARREYLAALRRAA